MKYVRMKIVGVATVMAFLAVVPFIFSQYNIYLINSIIILSIFGVAFNLAFGFAELPAFGHAAFYGLGAYGLALTLDYTPKSIAVPIVVAILAAFLYSILVGVVSVRGSGIYFALLTFTFGQLLYELFFRLKFTGGDNGLTIAIPDRYEFLGDIVPLYYISLIILICLLVFSRRLLNSPFGKVFLAIAHNENRARSIGYPVSRVKVVVFVLTATLASFAGILYTLNNRFVSPNILFYTTSIDGIIVATIGGTGSLIGPIVGSIFYILMTEFTSEYANIGTMIVGAVFIGIVLYFPRGIMGIFDRF